MRIARLKSSPTNLPTRMMLQAHRHQPQRCRPDKVTRCEVRDGLHLTHEIHHERRGRLEHLVLTARYRFGRHVGQRLPQLVDRDLFRALE